MAAVTVVSQDYSVVGDRRMVSAVVSAAATGDTFVTGLVKIFTCQCDGGSTTAINTTFSGGTVTLNYAGGGTASSADLLIIGL